MTSRGTPPTLDDMDQISRFFSQRLVAFLKTLRDASFAVGLREGQDAAALLAAGYGEEPDLLRSSFKHLFSARKTDWTKFDGIFNAFWLGRHDKSRIAAQGTPANAKKLSMKSLQEKTGQNAAGTTLDQMASVDEDKEEDRSGHGQAEGASRVENLTETDFRKLVDPADIADAHAVAARLARVMRARLTRRERARRRGYRLDLRRTIHRNISHGGVPISPVWRQRKQKPLRLVVLLDTSGSMSMYTGVFLRFIHGVLDAFREAEAFLFHTRLVHISDAMKEKDATRAFDRLSLLSQGAGGGTRIGESLSAFNRWHAARVIHSRTCVIILSDGYETGDAVQLEREMRQLAKRCRRVVWLNPMMGWNGYAPEAAGMKAALPHIDLLATAHTIESLAALEPYLAKL